MYLFSNILGVFVFDENFKIVDEILFKDLNDYKNKEKFIESLRNKHNLAVTDKHILKTALIHFKSKKFFNDFYNINMQLTKSDVKSSVKSDILIVQAVHSIEELDKILNILSKRLREWYELYNPEFSAAMKEHEKFIEDIIRKDKNELLKCMKLISSDSIGADLKSEDLEPIMSFARQIHELYQLRKGILGYVSISMDKVCPNIKAVCGVYLGARLIEKAGSLKRLSELPASTVQILGAENALFRHLKTGAKPPRHGVILNHPLLAKAPDRMHGKIARALADKTCIASKIDYFQGKFIGDKLKIEIEKKFGSF